MSSYYFTGLNTFAGSTSFPSPTFTGVSSFPAGTAAAPSIALGAATDGLFQVSSGIVGLTGAGTETARFSATVAQIPAAAGFFWNGRTQLLATSNGVIQVTNNANSASPTVGSVGVIIGPASTNGVYLTNRGSNGRLGVRFGDDSNYAGIQTGGMIVSLNQQSAISDGSNTGFGVLSNNASVFANTAIQFLAGNAANVDNAAINFKTTRATTTLSLASATTTILTLPVDCIIMAVTARVTTAITASVSTSWSLGAGAVANDWGTGLAFAQNTTVTMANYAGAGFTGPAFFAAGTAIKVTLNVDAATAGAVKVVVYYMDVTAPANNN